MEKAKTFTPASVRRIGSAYKANRGLLGEKSEVGKKAKEESSYVPAARVGDFHADGLASLLNARIADWRNAKTIRQRADVCLAIANKALVQSHTNRIQISIVSKLMWFVEPAGWTVFDQFAVKGAICHRPLAEERKHQTASIGRRGSDDNTAFVKANRFYDRLGRIAFVENSSRGNEIIRSQGWGKMPMERIYDQELWLKGLTKARREVEVQAYRHFLGCLPTSARSSLDQLVLELGGMPSMVDAARDDHLLGKTKAKKPRIAKGRPSADGISR